METKSGQLKKYTKNFLGSRWKPKWVHLHENYLKYYPTSGRQHNMQKSLIALKPRKCIDLRTCTVSRLDKAFQRKYRKKHAFQLSWHENGNQTSQMILACESQRECQAWIDAIESRCAGKLNDQAWARQRARRSAKLAEDSFALCDPSNTKSIPCSKLRLLLDCIGWTGSSTEFLRLQRQLDPDLQGHVDKARFLHWYQEVESSLALPAGSTVEPDETSPSAKDTTRASSSDMKDWNAQYQALMHPPHSSEDQVRTQMQLVTFLGEWKTEIEDQVVSVVHDLTLPIAEQTLRPCTGQDLATNEELSLPLPYAQGSDVHYHINGIDYFIFDSSTSLHSHKVLGHEVRAVQALASTVSNGSKYRHFLQSVVDYLGFRLYVVAFPRGGLTVASELCPEETQALTRALNISNNNHGIVRDWRLMQGTLDHKLYLTRLHRVFPLDAGTASVDPTQQLRPEILRRSSASLSEARAPGVDDNLEDVMVDYSSDLVHQVMVEFLHSMETLECIPLDAGTFGHVLHHAGLNARHLLKLYKLARLPHVRELIATDIIARACKSIYRHVFSTLLESLEEPDEILGSHVEFFNLVLGQSKECSVFWTDQIEPTIESLFGGEQASSSLISSLSLLIRSKHKSQLFWALQYHIHVRLEDHMNYPFHRQGLMGSLVACPITRDHVQSYLPATTLSIKMDSDLNDDDSDSDVDTFDVDFENAENVNRRDEAQDFMKCQLRLTMEQVCGNDHTGVRLGRRFIEAAQMCLFQHQDIERAQMYVEGAMDATPASHGFMAKCLVLKMHILAASEDVDDQAPHAPIQALAKKALAISDYHFGSCHPLRYEILNFLSHYCEEQLQDLTRAIAHLDDGLKVLRHALGGTHAALAEANFRQGQLLQQAKQYDRAVMMYEDTIHIYDRAITAGDDPRARDDQQAITVEYIERAGECCFELSAILIDMNSFQESFKYALRGLTLREKVGTDVRAILASMDQIARLSELLNEDLRAIQYYRQAIVLMKEESGMAEEIQTWTNKVTQLYFQSMSAEKQMLLEKQKREQQSDDALLDVKDCMSHASEKLYSKDPVTYLDQIFDVLVAKQTTVRKSSLTSTASIKSDKYDANAQLMGILCLLQVPDCY